MSRALDDLAGPFAPLAMQLIARCIERGVAVMIVDTLRTEAEHRVNLANGTSKVKVSTHLPARLRGFSTDHPDAEKSHAIDLAPYDVYQLHGADKLQCDASDAAWRVIGEEAARLGLRWGGHWESPRDPGHCELPNPQP